MKINIYIIAILIILSMIILLFGMDNNNSSSPFIINTFDGQKLYAKEIVDSVDMYLIQDNYGRNMIVPKTSVINIIFNK
jgi:hypothetical protein